MLDELGRELAYPKIRRRLHWDQETISRYLLLLRFKTEVVGIDGVSADVPDDPHDPPILATLIAGGVREKTVKTQGDSLVHTQY